ncbi:hypothetical protein [Mesorhizobium sp. INR15]|uniref:hypothetical protein n=1 Tax=Mesorhizobium sp. INR15 TaxID=2654248 RepID=UPI0021560BC7|nr:hypothetical protein [Mesorhizobium sp. INR15]
MTPLDAEPNVVLKMPGDSILPFLLSVGMTGLFFGLLAQVIWLVALGAVCEFGVLALWLTPEPQRGIGRGRNP